MKKMNQPHIEEKNKSVLEKFSCDELINATTTFLWITTPNKGAIFFNNAWLNFTNRSLAQELGNGWQDGLHPDDASDVIKKIKQFEKKKNNYSIEFRIRSSKNNYRWILCNASPRFDYDSKFAGFVVTAFDVTEIKNTEQTLKRLETAVDFLHESVVVGDINGIIFYANDASVKMFEEDIDKKDLIGITYFDLFESHHMSKAGEDFKELLKKEIIINKGYTFLTKNNNKKYLEMSASIVKDEKENSIGFISVIRDITEKKIAEQRISESEKRYRNLYENAPIGIFRTTTDGHILIANPHLISMLGYNSLEDLQTQNLNNMMVSQVLSRSDYQKLLENSGSVSSVETAFYKKDGSIIYTQENAVVVKDDAGYIKYYEGTIEDITKRKMAEEALKTERELFTNGPVIVFKWRAAEYWPVEYVSSSIQSALGYTPQELIEGKVNFHELIHPDDFYKVADEIRDYSLSKLPTFRQEYRLKHNSGEYRWFSDYTLVIRDKENNITHYLGYLLDITERKLDREILAKSEQDLKKLVAMKDRFFSIIAHDLRSPFQGLIGITNILLEDDELTHEERITFTNKLLDGLRAEHRLLEDLLTWSKLQQGGIDFDPLENSIKDDILEAINSVTHLLEKKGIKINLLVEKPLRLIYDRNMIATVLRNLISNSIKFTQTGGIIEVGYVIKENRLIVSVKDDGIGISEQNIAKLFKNETHFSTRGTNSESGSGLGLILCKDFIEKHSGCIWVESMLGKGSTFYFSLPL
jgi:PAS domain S-box-containing protein